jgi:radical SAM protein (TIGR01212 family)
MFKYSNTNKRYHTLDYYYKNRFNCKIAKISLNGGFTCPNKDGTKGVGGCIYCSTLGSGDFAGNLNKSITEQFYEIKEIMDNKWENTKYIAYFQANTNTYADVETLKKKYEEALKIPNVVGLNIATRSDAITEECLNYLEELSKKTFLNIELGLQTINKKTNELINRGETLEEFDLMVKKLRSRGINVIIHIINGLPYETKEDMINTIKYINSLDIQGVKIHMLHIIKNTKLEELYNKEHFHVLTREEYVNIVCDQLELLRPEIVINRITGDPKKEDLIEPSWLLKKFCVLNDIDKELKKRNTYQGAKIKE